MKFDSVTIFHNYYGIKVGGSEAYTAHLFKLFEKDFDLFLVPGGIAKKNDLKTYTMLNYDICIAKEIHPGSFFARGLFINCAHSEKIFFYGQKRSIHIVHFPYDTRIIPRKNLFKIAAKIIKNMLYPYIYRCYVCNSEFTASYFRKFWGKIPAHKIEIVYPPVRLFYNVSATRESQIIIFSRIAGEKKIDILIDVFNKNYGASNTRLVIMGSVNDRESREYLLYLRSFASRNVEFIINPERERIASICNKSLIFWHAKGYRESDPFEFEHFGIITVEAMSAGVIPVVINKGGQKEIVDHGINGFKWDTLDELVSYTNQILALPPSKKLELSLNASEKAKNYGEDKFQERFLNLLRNLDLCC
jgi:glycosyltransferase involved in cell wall biosynthesis